MLKLFGFGVTEMPGGTGLAEDSYYWDKEEPKPVIDPERPFQVRVAYPGGLGWELVKSFATYGEAQADCDARVSRTLGRSSWTVLKAVEVRAWLGQL